VLGGSRNAIVCSSDVLYFDAEVPALGADDLLRPGQIYFVLPAAMLGRQLSKSDMAVRASEALAPRPRARGLVGTKRARVVPSQEATGCGYGEVNEEMG
jgi:hypothetical protein